MYNNESSLDYIYLYANTIVKYIFNIFFMKEGPRNVKMGPGHSFRGGRAWQTPPPPRPASHSYLPLDLLTSSGWCNTKVTATQVFKRIILNNHGIDYLQLVYFCHKSNPDLFTPPPKYKLTTSKQSCYSRMAPAWAKLRSSMRQPSSGSKVSLPGNHTTWVLPGFSQHMAMLSLMFNLLQITKAGHLVHYLD